MDNQLRSKLSPRPADYFLGARDSVRDSSHPGNFKIQAVGGNRRGSPERRTAAFAPCNALPPVERQSQLPRLPGREQPGASSSTSSAFLGEALHRKVAGGIERSSVRDPDNLGLRGSSLVPQGRGGQERRDSFQLHQHQQSDSDSDGSPLRAPRYQPSGHHPDGLRSKMLTGLSRNGSSLLPTPLPPTGPPGRSGWGEGMPRRASFNRMPLPEAVGKSLAGMFGQCNCSGPAEPSAEEALDVMQTEGRACSMPVVHDRSGRSSPIAQQQGRTVGRTNSQTCDVQRKPSFTTRYGVPFGSEGNPSRGRSPDASSGCPSSLPEPTTPVDMLVEAVRSKENSRLVQVVQQLRDLDSGEVLGINDCHELTGRTPLHEAVALARLSSVQLLLNYGANPNVCHPTRGPPILHAAAWAEDQLIAILLKNGADINAEDCTGQTALHCACAAGHASSTQLLLECGADRHHQTHSGEVPEQLTFSDVIHSLFAELPDDSGTPDPATRAQALARVMSSSRPNSQQGDRGRSPRTALSRNSSSNSLAGQQSESPQWQGSGQQASPRPYNGFRPSPRADLHVSSGADDSPQHQHQQEPAGGSTAQDGGDSPRSSRSSPSPRAAASGLRLAPGADSGSSFSGAQRPPSGRERRRMSGVCLADILEAVQEDSIAQHQPTPSQVTTNQQAQPADDNHSPMSRAGSQVAMSPQPTHNPRTTISKAENSVPASDSWRQPSSADVERSESSNQQVRRRTRQSLGDSETGLRNTRQPGGESPDNGPLYDLDGPRRPLLPGPRSNVEGAGRAGAAARDAAVPLLVLDHSPPSTPGTARSGGSGTLVSPSPGSGTLRSPSPRTPKTPLWRVGLSPRPGSGRSPAAAIDTVEHITKAMGTPRQGLEMRANQLFHQSVEVETGDVHWTKGELLGEGAYGKVFVGLNQQNGELMAVKEMILAGTKNSPEQRVQLESLEREISLYRNIQHRHVVGYIAAHMDFEASKLYIFLEYVPGGSIATMLERFGAFSEQLVANYTRQLLLGLEYLHGCKVIHRDVKGANVLVTRDGRVKLADFGASKAYHETTVTDGMKSIRGSVYWMAPEMLKGVGYGRRADIWSVGCTVIEMLTGKHPWPDLDNHWSAMFAIAKTESGPPLPDNISDDCRDFLQRCLKHDPRERPTATELLQHAFVGSIGAAFREAELACDLTHSL